MRPSRLKRPPRAAETPTPPSGDYTIERLGTDGAGMLRHGGTWFAVPFMLPGERIRLSRPGVRAQILEASPERTAPPCPHFGDCGGCRLQHLSATSYADYKRRSVVDALARVGLRDVPVSLACISPPNSRRRATVKAIRTKTGALLGFNALQESRIVDILDCPLLVASLAEILPALRTLMGTLLSHGQTASVILTATDTGVDAGISGLAEPVLETLERLAEFAHRTDLARLFLAEDGVPPVPVIERRRPTIRFGETEVALPPGGFLQATVDGERALVTAARAALASSKRIVDLFAGIGTFSLALAKEHTVLAVEHDPAAVQAFDSARKSAGLTNARVLQRDLHERPLTAEELRAYDAVLIDPPRAGAAAQSREIAQSGVSRIAAVSCNPATFARDATILIDGGFQLQKVAVIDQFLWSPHVELIAEFERRR